MVHYFLCVSHGEKGSVSFELAMHRGRFKLQASSFKRARRLLRGLGLHPPLPRTFSLGILYFLSYSLGPEA